MPWRIKHDMDANRFGMQTDHGEATLDYRRANEDTLDYRSTYVPEEDRGHGIGETLVLHAVDWAEETGFKVLPSCPFVRRILQEHPERAAVVS